jgi:hypothetical protein
MLKGTVSGWEDEFFLEVDGGGSYTNVNVFNPLNRVHLMSRLFHHSEGQNKTKMS